MPQPTRNEVHVDRVLSNVSIGFQQSAEGFVADRVFPVVPVEKQSDLYFTYDKSYWYRSEMQKRAPATESAGAGYGVSTASYRADVWALHKDIDDQTRANADEGIDMEGDATRFLSLQALLRKDKTWVANFFTTGLWTGDQTGVAAGPGANQFLQFDQSASDPFKTIRAQILAVQKRTGYKPNTLVMGAEVWNTLADHAALTERIKYTERAIIDTELLASALGIDRVFIASGVENTGPEGGTASYSFIAGKSMLLVYSAARPSLQEPSGGYTFSWTGLEGAGGLRAAISTFRMDPIKSDRVEIEMAWDQKLVAPEMGVFFASVIA
jgi:hypothetical protein